MAQFVQVPSGTGPLERGGGVQVTGLVVGQQGQPGVGAAAHHDRLRTAGPWVDRRLVC